MKSSLNKMSFLALSLALSAASAFANDTRIDLNGRYGYLGECGGTISAKTESGGFFGSDQIKIDVRNVKECSNFTVENTGTNYKLPEAYGGERNGLVWISAGDLHSGYNTLRLTVASNSGMRSGGRKGHSDTVYISVNVSRRGGSVGGGSRYAKYACGQAAAEAVQQKTGSLLDQIFISDSFDRVSRKGNYVYNVNTLGRSYEVTTSRSCQVLGIQKQ